MANKALADALKTDKVFVKTVEPVDEDIKKWVEDCHKEYLADPEAWRQITFASRTDMDNILVDARRYTNEIRKTPLTISTSGDPVQHPNGSVTLKYRVRTKTGAGRPKGSQNGATA